MSDKEKKKEEEELNKLEKEKDVRYPIENIPEDMPSTNKNVEQEVKELNPKVDSLGKR